MAARIATVWPRFVDHLGQPPTYRVVLDGVELPTIYTDRARAKAMADRYNAVAASNATDIYGRAL